MIVPGLVAVIMMIIAAMLTSLTIAREWERGTLEQLAATPVGRVEVVLGKLLPYVGIGLLDVAAATLLGVFLFAVPFRGNPALFMVLSFFFLLGGLGLGIFISAATRSQMLATQVSMVVTFLPAFLLSGFMFPIAVMPPVLRAVTYLVPARYFLVVTRGIFLKGVGVEVLRVQGRLMIAFAAVGRDAGGGEVPQGDRSEGAGTARGRGRWGARSPPAAPGRACCAFASWCARRCCSWCATRAWRACWCWRRWSS